jgi:predicted O-methyltransferase YrrM
MPARLDRLRERALERAFRWFLTHRRDYAIQAVADQCSWEDWERNGFNLTEAGFYSPIPPIHELPSDIWARRSELPGIEVREDAQLALLRELRASYGGAWDALPEQADDPSRFQLRNMTFESVDAEIAYGLFRSVGPKRVVEIGSGWSTLLALEALERNTAEGRPGSITACEPYPSGALKLAAESGRIDLIVEPVQGVPLDVFLALGAGDVLFIDSSHVCRIGSDVQYEFLDVLPRLAPGVLVHVHDIFLPYEYPRSWVEAEKRFWNEQYVLQAFLAFNGAYEVVWMSGWMSAYHPSELDGAIRSFDPGTHRPGSVWLRRRPVPNT